MQKDFFYIVLLGFAGGIFLRSFFNFGIPFSLLFLFVGSTIFVFWYFKKGGDKKHEQEKILITGLLLFFMGMGMLRFDIDDFGKNNSILGNLVGEKIVATALVVDEPYVRETNTRLTIKFEDMPSIWGFNPQIEGGVGGKVIITVNHYPQFSYGDEINITGILQKPKNFNTDDDGGMEFDYVSYLAKDGIYYQMLNPTVTFISDGNGNFIKEKLFALKNSFIQQVRKLVPEPHSALLGGLVVGAKESLGKGLQEDFRKVGLIHIVVLSGYNLTIVADSIMKILVFLPSSFAMIFGALGIILFTLMTGASATIVRASIMALLVMLARLTGRTNQVTRTLFLAGFLMLLHNPKILVFDPSFQLSFMATLGLIILSPKIEKYFHFLPTKFQLRELAVATISTQIFVLPLILYMMGDFSIIAIVVNLLVLMFIPITMLFGFFTGVLAFLSTAVALPFAYISYFLLSYELKVVDIFSSLPFASIHIPYFPFWLMVFVYASYFIFLGFLSKKEKKPCF